MIFIAVLLIFLLLATKHFQKHKSKFLYKALTTLPALWQHSIRVYRALALNAEFITGVAGGTLDVISTSTHKT